MLTGDHREQVVGNIQDAANHRDFYRRVEVDDPELSKEERNALLESYLKRQHTLGFMAWRFSARITIWFLTRYLNRHTKIEGLEYLSDLRGGAVITSNHFSPLDNSAVRQTVYRAFHQRLYIVSRDVNLAVKGITGYFLNYADVVPISSNLKYMRDYFDPTIKNMLEEGRKILIYPEQEMWFNYRKPRPPKRGPYYYAASNAVPVISLFVEIRDLNKLEQENLLRTAYTVHVLPPIYPDPDKSVRDNSKNMMEIDYRQKRDAYEHAYGHPLVYDYQSGDVAGWIPDSES